MIHSCRVPFLRELVVAARQHCQVPAAAAQTCRGGSGRREAGPNPVFPMGKPTAVGSAVCEQSWQRWGKRWSVGLGCLLCFAAAVGTFLQCANTPVGWDNRAALSPSIGCWRSPRVSLMPRHPSPAEMPNSGRAPQEEGSSYLFLPLLCQPAPSYDPG